MPVNVDVAMDAAHKIYDRLIKLGRSDVEARRDAESWVRTTWGITIQLPMPAPALVRRRVVRRVRPPSAPPPPPPAGRSGQDGANLCIKCRVSRVSEPWHQYCTKCFFAHQPRVCRTCGDDLPDTHPDNYWYCWDCWAAENK